MFRRSVTVILLCFIFFLVLISGVQAVNLTCRSNLTYASDYYACGNDLVDQNRYEDALLAFRTARSMDERFYDEHYGISYQIGWVLNRLGRYEEALTEFEKAEKYHPEWINNFAIYYNEGTLNAKLGRYEDALKKFDQSLTIQYWNRYAWFNKGYVLAKLGRYAEAKDAYEKARKSYGSYVPLLGSYQEAANTYDVALGKSPSELTPSPILTRSASKSPQPSPTYISGLSTDLQLRKASDFSARYQFEDAVQAFDQVLVNDPSNYRAMEGKGVAQANLGRFEDALTSLNQSTLYLDYHRDESYYIDAWYVKGWVLANQGKYDEAIDAFNKALMVDPDVFVAHYNKAWVLAKQGQYSAAVTAYNRSLDWENQVGNQLKSITILAPLGDYKDAAVAIDKADKPDLTQQQVQTPPHEVLIYQTDFSQDPQWQTDRPRLYFWDPAKQMYHFISDENLGYAEIPVLYNGTSFRMEFDIIIPHADPGTFVHFGLSHYNASYNSQDAILGEFKSWRAGMYRNLKDGDKGFQIIAIDDMKRITDGGYNYACFLNREVDRSIPTFGENRIYHVIIIYEKDKDVITTKISDNLHEKNYYNCAGMLDKLGKFPNMDRLILAAREGENAYIEGYIDNLTLSSIDTSAAPVHVLPSGSTTSPETSGDTNTTTSSTTLPGGGGLDFSIIVIALPLLIAGIAGTGFYVWQKSRKTPPPELARQRVQKLHQSVGTRIAALEFFSVSVRPLFEKSENFITEEKYREAENELFFAEKRIREIEKLEITVRQWKKEGFDLSPLLLKVNNNPDDLIPAFNEFKSGVAKSNEFEHELAEILREHQEIVKEEKISRHIEWIQQNIKDPLQTDRITEEINEIRRCIIAEETTKNQIETFRDFFDSVTSQASGIAIFGAFIQGRIEQARLQFESGDYETAYEILKKIEPEIDELKRDEIQIKKWKSQGYSTIKIESASYATLETIKIRIDEFGQNVDKIQKIKIRLQNLKKSHQKTLSLPEFSASLSIIEQKITDPDEEVFLEKEINHLEEKVQQTEYIGKEQTLKIRSHIEKIRSSPDVRDSTKKMIIPIEKACIAENFIVAEQMLNTLAVQNIGILKTEINQLKNEGAFFPQTTEILDAFIKIKNYSDAILETEKCSEKMERLKQIFAQAKVLRTTTTDPNLITVFDNGQYAEFIRLLQNKEKQVDQRETARKDAQDLLEQAEKIGIVPEPVYHLIHSSVPEEIEHAIEELAKFKKTARPRLTLSLNRRKMEVHVWHRVNISIENTGNAHALDVNFSFSREFETRWIRPKSINAGKTETFESIAIKPTIKGEVPLEISLTFHDTQNHEYTEKEEFFIDVTESATPHTPAYTPEATPSKIPSKKQLPSELTPMYVDSQYIGRGGFARVFKATKRDGKNVAIKVPISIDPSTGRTFVSEIQNWTKMVHENIVKVYDYNIMPPYFEMELCDESLANLKKPVPNEKAAWLVFSICEGLKYAHSQNIIHRDLKPQNILLKNGIPKISDWGLSRVMQSQSTTSASGSFTLYYAAPEQVNNRKQDARTDLWQLGVIFYELTTGTLPFKGETVTDTIIAIATQDPVQPSTINPEAKELDSIVMRCLEKDPAKRYQSVLELQMEIGTFLKMNYTNSLNESLISKNYGRSADYCADLLLVNMKLGGMVDAYKYASDLVQFVSGELKTVAEEFAEQLKVRMEMNLLTIPDELINKADILVHKIKMQRK